MVLHDIMANNSSSITVQNQKQSILLIYSVILFRSIGSFAIIMNVCVILLTIKLRKTFRNYSYWFQILVLASQDLLNGISSFSMSFYDYEVFKINYIACTAILWLFVCCQINTLMAMCCICINRFRRVRNIDKLGENRSGYQQELSILLVSVFSIIYASIPYFAFERTTTYLQNCSPVYFFPVHINDFKILFSAGLGLPLIIINCLYGICLFKLRNAVAKVKPVTKKGTTQIVSCSQVTKETTAENDYSVTPTVDRKGGLFHNISSRINRDPDEVKDSAYQTNISVVTSLEECSTSYMETTFGAGRQQQAVYSEVHKGRRETQVRAVKLLGIILFTSDIATIIPLSFMIRDVVLWETSESPHISAGGTALGIVFLSLNSLVDSFVYGLYAVEIRSFILTKYTELRQYVASYHA